MLWEYPRPSRTVLDTMSDVLHDRAFHDPAQCIPLSCVVSANISQHIPFGSVSREERRALKL